ncbi:benzaldehyde dehydrogenase [Microbacterium halophytorum]|uniref:benzaldehyde dehydrogenase n=1 Tax=Microbacterium halophytorum TaxID=2067568 RepID=UPI000CFB4747|nr:benzaldehyde dehydrogenase [Microbacterium halophytorum]
MTLLDTALWSGRISTGSWQPGHGGAYDVVAPATGEVLGSIGSADASDAYAASARAAEAQRGWAAKAPEERAAVLRRAGLLFEEHAEEIQGWIIREAGSIPPKAGLETHIAANECFDSSALPHLAQGEVLPSDEARWSFARRKPIGVVSVIAPFNFPLILAIRAVAPALATGNAVLLKPDPRTAVCAGVSIMRVFEEAGLPAGVLQLLPGGADVGSAVVDAPEVGMVAFTGSTGAGRKIGETCGRLLKRAHLELGGNNAMIVLPGVDVAKAASAAAFGSWMHQGQICMTTGRHIVHESVYDEYVAALVEKANALPVGDPASEQVALGPLIDDGQTRHCAEIVADARSAGATIAAGGTHEGRFFRPTVITDLDRDNRAWAEEIFGPVAPVMKFSTVDEAVELANDCDFGLSIGVLGNVSDAMVIADRLDSGKVHINEQTVSDESQAPFGGTKSSGNGTRIGGATTNLEAFTEIQWLTVRPEIADYPF